MRRLVSLWFGLGQRATAARRHPASPGTGEAAGTRPTAIITLRTDFETSLYVEANILVLRLSVRDLQVLPGTVRGR